MTEIQKENCVTGLTDFVRFMYGNSIHDCWVNIVSEILFGYTYERVKK
jgi:hypothetical protein